MRITVLVLAALAFFALILATSAPRAQLSTTFAGGVGAGACSRNATAMPVNSISVM